jgi:hypothetical protein
LANFQHISADFCRFAIRVVAHRKKQSIQAHSNEQKTQMTYSSPVDGEARDKLSFFDLVQPSAVPNFLSIFAQIFIFLGGNSEAAILRLFFFT